MSDQLSSQLAKLSVKHRPVAPPTSSSGAGKRVVVVGLIAAGVVGLGVFVWGKMQGQIFKQEVRVTEVSMISPAQADVQVTATGYVIPQRTSKVGSKLPGRLAKVFVQEGDTVKENDVIAQLEDADQKSQIASAASRVGSAAARAATARANLAEVSQQVARERALVQSGAIGRAQLDDLVARESALKAAVAAAEADITTARSDVGTFDVGLKDRVIVTPIPGRVVSKPATVGEFVGGVGNPLPIAEIVDFASMLVEVDVPEARLHRVKPGGPCEVVLDAYPNRSLKGVVKELGHRVNRQKATVMVKVKFADGEDLDGVLPEMSARVSFLSKPMTDAEKKAGPKKVVPKEAIIERGGQKVVFTVDNGKLHAINVTPGAPVGDSAIEIVDGPPPGSKIVAKPTPEMQDGERIKENEK